MQRVLGLALVSLALIAIAALFAFRAREPQIVAPALDVPSARVATSPSKTAELEHSLAELTESLAPEAHRAVNRTPAGENAAERMPATNAAHVPGLTLRGRVTSLAGGPIVGANVRIRSAVNGGRFVGTTSGFDGAFELSGLTPAIYTLDVRARAHVTREIWPLVYSDAEPLPDIEVVLTPVATLTGRMLDEREAAVPGVFVYAKPVNSLMAATVSMATREDGSFTLPLDADARHWIWTEVGRYSGWKSWLTDAPDFAPSTSGIEIRVRRTQPTRVFAADTATRAPLRRFGLDEFATVMPWSEKPERDLDPLALQARPPNALLSDAGVPLLVEAPPQRVVVWAEGYAVRVHTLSADPEQTVFLEPLGGLRGSFSRHGAQFTQATLIARTHGRSAPTERGPTIPERTARASTDATFDVDDLPPGAYDVFARVAGRGQTLALRTNVAVVPGRVTDLGVLDLAAETACVRMKLALPADASARDYLWLLHAELNGGDLAQPSRIDGAEEQFGYDELPAGRFEIVFAKWDALLGPTRRWFASLAPGSVHELKLDLSDVTLCDVSVQLASDSPHTATDHVCVRAADSDARVQLSCLALIQFGGELDLRARGSSRMIVDACDAQHHPLSSSGPIELPRTGRREIVLFVP